MEAETQLARDMREHAVTLEERALRLKKAADVLDPPKVNATPKPKRAAKRRTAKKIGRPNGAVRDALKDIFDTAPTVVFTRKMLRTMLEQRKVQTSPNNLDKALSRMVEDKYIVRVKQGEYRRS